MTRRFLSLSIIIVLLLAFKFTLSQGIGGIISQDEFINLLNSENPESHLALGFKLSLRELEGESLEFIPGLSDDSKSKLLLKKNEIRASAKELPKDKKHTALLKVKGIGKKKAQDIYQVLSLE